MACRQVLSAAVQRYGAAGARDDADMDGNPQPRQILRCESLSRGMFITTPIRRTYFALTRAHPRTRTRKTRLALAQPTSVRWLSARSERGAFGDGLVALIPAVDENVIRPRRFFAHNVLAGP